MSIWDKHRLHQLFRGSIGTRVLTHSHNLRSQMFAFQYVLLDVDVILFAYFMWMHHPNSGCDSSHHKLHIYKTKSSQIISSHHVSWFNPIKILAAGFNPPAWSCVGIIPHISRLKKWKDSYRWNHCFLPVFLWVNTGTMLVDNDGWGLIWRYRVFTHIVFPDHKIVLGSSSHFSAWTSEQIVETTVLLSQVHNSLEVSLAWSICGSPLKNNLLPLGWLCLFLAKLCEGWAKLPIQLVGMIWNH